MNQQLILIAMVSTLTTSCATTQDEIVIDEEIFVDEIDADASTGDPALNSEISLGGESALTRESASTEEPALTAEPALTTESPSLTTEPIVSGEPLSITDMNDALMGNTFPLENGGIYFDSNSVATIYRDGNSEQMDWWQNDGGEYCYGVKQAGGVEECIGLSRDANGDYLQSSGSSTRTIRRDEISVGDRLY